MPQHNLARKQAASSSPVSVSTGQEVKEDRLAGSTATVLLARRDKLVVANVGDSRAILSRNGQAIHLSSEHR